MKYISEPHHVLGTGHYNDHEYYSYYIRWVILHRYNSPKPIPSKYYVYSRNKCIRPEGWGGSDLIKVLRDILGHHPPIYSVKVSLLTCSRWLLCPVG